MSVQILLDRIDRVRRRERNVSVTAGLFKTVLAVLGLVVGFFILDWLVLSKTFEAAGSNRSARAVLLLAMALSLGYVIWRTIWLEVIRELDDDEVALRVEKRHPELRGRLISTIQLTREIGEGAPIGSPELIEALEADTVSYSQALDFTQIISFQTLKKVALAAFLFVLVSAAAGYFNRDFVEALVGRMLLDDADYPTATRIIDSSVTRGGAVPRGESFVVELRVEEALFLPDHATLIAEPDAGGETLEYILANVPTDGRKTNLYRGKIDRVMEALSYRVEAYDDRWPRSGRRERIRVLTRPAVKSLVLKYTFPPYTNKDAKDETVGDIRALAGTRIEIVATLNKEVRRRADREKGKPHGAILELRYGVGQPRRIPMDVSEDGGTASATIGVERDGYYRILLHDMQDLGNVNPIEYVIDAREDRKPKVKITFPGEDKTVTRFAEWPIHFRMTDDWGVSKGRLMYRVRSLDADAGAEGEPPEEAEKEPAESLPLDGLVAGANEREIVKQIPFNMALFHFDVDTRVTYWLEVDDNRSVWDEQQNKWVSKPNTGRSKQYEFNIADEETVRSIIEIERNDTLSLIETIRRKEMETYKAVIKLNQAIRRGELDK